jgi:hypothetical protein
VNPRWFPRLDGNQPAVQGHMPKQQQVQYVQLVTELVNRHPHNVERLGDRVPGRRR